MFEIFRLRRALVMPAGACALLLAGCSETAEKAASRSEQSAATGPRFAKEVQPILDDNCVACHQTGSAQEALVLEPGKAFAAIVDVKSQESALKLVDPGKAGQSYLQLKLEGKHQQAGGTGAQMPLGDALTPAQIATVRQWIDAGALNN